MINRLVCVAIVVALQACASSQTQPTKPTEPKSAPEPNSVLEERLRNATITTKQLENGAKFTELQFAGSLEPNVDLGCIPMRDVTNRFNPPALIYAAKKCVQQEKYTEAWILMTTGNGFAYYDLKRLADISTRGALMVLFGRALSDLTPAQNEKAAKATNDFLADPEQVKAYCKELTRIGPPAYDPQWAILHGIGAYEEPRDGHYLTKVDAKAIWDEVLRNRCTPTRP
ncbi:MAG: hypothetical protein B7X02_02955 [Rhodospirillales bacterium 12-54-5]|nr:MAG: hypothetical protein B7X02_02955 [Rhodospirillales bacterium 12-54-5]